MRDAADQPSKPRARVALPANLAPRGLSGAETAAYLGIGRTLFSELVRDDAMPKPVRVGGRSVWDRRKLDAALYRLVGGAESPAEDIDPWEKLALKRDALSKFRYVYEDRDRHGNVRLYFWRWERLDGLKTVRAELGTKTRPLFIDFA